MATDQGKTSNMPGLARLAAAEGRVAPGHRSTSWHSSASKPREGDRSRTPADEESDVDDGQFKKLVLGMLREMRRDTSSACRAAEAASHAAQRALAATDDTRAAVDNLAAKQDDLTEKLEQLQVPKETGREEDERVELLAQQEHKVATFAATHESVKVLLKDEAATPDALVDAAAEALAESLDAEKGAGVTQHEIFDAHARRYDADCVLSAP
jgi:hypothetical protein